MHDDDFPIKPEFAKVTLRHFDHPVSIRELLHSTLDRLLDEMVAHSEPQGAVAVTNMDAGDNPFSGRTVVLALDLDPHDEEFEEPDEGSDGN